MSLIELLDDKNILEAVVDKIGDAVSIQDLNFKVLYQNQANKNIIGNHLGEYCFKAYEHRESICDGCPLALTFSDGGVHSTVRSCMTDKGLTYVDITASALHNSKGEIVGGIEVAKDITGRKQAEEELLASQKMLEAITQGITESILLLSKDFRIVWANNTALQQTGLTLDGLVGNYCYRATHLRESPCEPPNNPCPVSELLQTAVPVTMEHIHYDRNGKKIFVEVSAYPVKDAAGEIINLVHISKDITERKELEEGLREKTAHIVKQSRELQEINAELNTLYEISRTISQTIDLNKLLYEILDTVTAINIFRLERKGILFLVEDNRMRIASTIGFPDSYLLEIHKDMMVGDCLCGLAAATGEMITSNNSDHDSRHAINDEQAGSHGHIIVPLKAVSKVVGVLCLYLPPDIALEPRDLKLLLSLGSQLGIVIENARIFEETKSLSLQDPLTGLANRRSMQMQLERNFAVVKRYGKPLSVIMLDLDHFKEYNDRYGHQKGDRLLVRVADILEKNRRGADGAFRYGGEEFLLMLPETDLTQATVIAERIRVEVAAEPGVTVSLGVSSYQEGMRDQDQLVKAADCALYRAKNNGRNRVEIVLPGALNKKYGQGVVGNEKENRMKNDQNAPKVKAGAVSPESLDLAKISEIARRALKQLVSQATPAIPPNYEKVFYNTAIAMGESELVNQIMATLPSGQAAAVMVEGLSSMITSINTDLKQYRAGLDQHGGQLDDKHDHIRKLVEPAVWKLLEKDFLELRNANNQMKQQLEVAETRLESQEQQVVQLQRKTRCDPLTGVMNRLAMDEDLPEELARSKRYGRRFGIVMADIDHFKRVNDTYGHAAGDEALKFFTRTLRHCLREVDIIYRYGGEEFVVLLPETDPQGSLVVAERLRRMVESQILKNREDASRQFRFTASFGVAVFREGDSTCQDIVKRADLALYRAKNNGRNRVEAEN